MHHARTPTEDMGDQRAAARAHGPRRSLFDSLRVQFRGPPTSGRARFGVCQIGLYYFVPALPFEHYDFVRPRASAEGKPAAIHGKESGELHEMIGLGKLCRC
jgi:hypothetical protein